MKESVIPCTFRYAKVNGRPSLVEVESGAVAYTPPEFIRILNRGDLVALGDELMTLPRNRWIDAITAFEKRARRAPGFNAQSCPDMSDP